GGGGGGVDPGVGVGAPRSLPAMDPAAMTRTPSFNVAPPAATTPQSVSAVSVPMTQSAGGPGGHGMPMVPPMSPGMAAAGAGAQNQKREREAWIGADDEEWSDDRSISPVVGRE
uniref:hypothetical protein n=1 Tax=Actinoalloteichus spitiensis TaxID=252394 RepID=UPI0005844557